ncbi:Single stranded DNA-binding protein, phage-associated [Pediococcus damnosus]|uniref:DUF669 domain-containing protein n=1 Tax=Pediococcus damnosus TaxID=51663 RepID=UPI00078B5423|nr:DUF669 domain-containing protein [Pediococcus damnosus]AMV65179.1 Single stranded DNA-binding protein, phage-associated [Pediococcus damnosus]
MSFLTADYSNNQENSFEAIPTGTYEVLINKAQEQATKNGAESLQLDLLIRNDLDKVPTLAETNAKYHNRHVFMDNWKRKNTNQYDTDSFQYILDAVKVPEGTVLNSVEDFAKAITGKPVQAYIKNEDNTYNGNTKKVNRVAPWNISETAYPEVNHKFKNLEKPTDNPFDSKEDISIDESDIPF